MAVEFAGHAEVTGVFGADFHFARPYHLWKHGLNEHTNGPMGDRIPKSTNFRKVDPAGIRHVRNALNNHPCRVLGFRKLSEVPGEVLAAVASRLNPGTEAEPDPG